MKVVYFSRIHHRRYYSFALAILDPYIRVLSHHIKREEKKGEKKDWLYVHDLFG
jgi:hypothetical protein